MVKNNGIPVEVNKKPFETVYELKNEIPTYEEFMKIYENDANLNYDDLSDGSIGEFKGYGPCTSSNCTHSRSELQGQLRELESRLKELENSVNIYYYRSEITVIQQNITIILGRLNSLPGSFY
jgi:hypothetical protein